MHVEFADKTNYHFVARACPPLADGRHARPVPSEACGERGRTVEGMAVPHSVNGETITLFERAGAGAGVHPALFADLPADSPEPLSASSFVRQARSRFESIAASDFHPLAAGRLSVL